MQLHCPLRPRTFPGLGTLWRFRRRARRGRVRVRHRRQTPSRLHLRHRRDEHRPLPPEGRGSNPRTGRQDDPRGVEHPVPRAGLPAGGGTADGGARGARFVLLHELGRGGDRSVGQAGAADVAPSEHHRLPGRLSRAHQRDDGAHLFEGELPQGLLAADVRRTHRAVPICLSPADDGRAGVGLLSERAALHARDPDAARRSGRNPDRKRAGRGRLYRAAGVVYARPARAVRRTRHPADPRRGAVRLRAHRQVVRVRAFRHRAGYHGDGQGDRVRPAAERHCGEPGADEPVDGGHARRHLHRQRHRVRGGLLRPSGRCARSAWSRTRRRWASCCGTG